jgi:DNA-binding MltR family transcriptional regulator
MGEPAYIRNFNAACKARLTEVNLQEIEQEIQSASDRAVIVIFAGLLERALADLIRSRFKPDMNSELRYDLFGHEGPIGSFSRQAAVAYGLGLIKADTYHDLDLIRIIRNGFAHSPRHLSFKMPEVIAICDQLRTPNKPNKRHLNSALIREAKTAGLAAGVFSDANPGYRFTTTCHTLAAWMIAATEGRAMDMDL